MSNSEARMTDSLSVKEAIEDIGKENNQYLKVQKTQKLFRDFSPEQLVPALAAACWDEPYKIAPLIHAIPEFRYRKKNSGQPLTIAVFTEGKETNGLERTMAMLCSMWSRQVDKNGDPLYRVILITANGDGGRPPYPVDAENILHLTLPKQIFTKENGYAHICLAWQELLSRYSIDAIVYTALYNRFMFWDLLSIKTHPSAPAVVLHWHSYFARAFGLKNNWAGHLYSSYLMADSIVVLSECDRLFASAFCRDVRVIANPLTFDPEEIRPSAGGNHRILWVGRLVPSVKQPQDAIEMMAEVLKHIPDATLDFLGNGDEKAVTRLQNMISTQGLSEHVRLVGFTSHPEEYYRNASLMVCTSKFEGFPGAVCEALSYAVPVLSYELPWVSFWRDGRGIVSVPRNNVHELAEEAVKLLSDPEKMKQIGRAGREHMSELARYPVAEEWNRLFTELGTEQTAPERTGVDIGDVWINTRNITENATECLGSVLRNLKKSQRESHNETEKYRKKAEAWQQRADEWQRRMEKQKRRADEWKRKSEKGKKQAEKWKNRYLTVTRSGSYKAGRVLTALPRLIGKRVRRSGKA